MNLYINIHWFFDNFLLDYVVVPSYGFYPLLFHFVVQTSKSFYSSSFFWKVKTIRLIFIKINRNFFYILIFFFSKFQFLYILFIFYFEKLSLMIYVNHNIFLYIFFVSLFYYKIQYRLDVHLTSRTFMWR